MLRERPLLVVGVVEVVPVSIGRDADRNDLRVHLARGQAHVGFEGEGPGRHLLRGSCGLGNHLAIAMLLATATTLAARCGLEAGLTTEVGDAVRAAAGRDGVFDFDGREAGDQAHESGSLVRCCWGMIAVCEELT